MYSRRRMLGLLAGFGAAPRSILAWTAGQGAVAGPPSAVEAGEILLKGGGNAVDAAVAAALACCVVDASSCGVAGYGGHMVIAAGGRVSSIDFNSTAPAAFREDIFSGPDGEDLHQRGWLAAGVPGTPAGLQLALDRHGSRSLAEVAAPAVRLAIDGFTVSKSLASGIARSAERLRRDAFLAAFCFPGGRPLEAGQTARNPALGEFLNECGRQGSLDAFYRGAAAAEIAQVFQRQGGVLTAGDLRAYQAREVRPLTLAWGDLVVHTAPLTAGGATVLQALRAFAELGGEEKGADPRSTHARLEVLNAAWADRLTYFGDPDQVEVPLDRLLSLEHARQTAARVRGAVREGRSLASRTASRQEGTVHVSTADAAGRMVALTLTHGDGFGAQVGIPSLGLILGHGMSRFERQPGHPNSPGPGKKPLHNMCPTVVTRAGRPILALGARGGRRIPNAVFDVLFYFLSGNQEPSQAVRSPRLHTTGGSDIVLESSWDPAHFQHLESLGYRVQKGSSAEISAVFASGQGYAAARR